MLFWIVAGAMAVSVLGLLARALNATPRGGAKAPADQAVYRDQLEEVGRDLARGLLAPDEAERARAEVARRLLAADRVEPPRLTDAPRAATRLATAATALVVLGSFVAYPMLGRPGAEDLPRGQRLAVARALRDGRPSQAQAEAQAAPIPPAPAPERYLEMVEELRRLVPTRPGDLRGWELLALHEAKLGRYAEAARAQQRVLALKGGRTTAEDWLGLADRLVAAAGGLVSPEAEAALAHLAERDPSSPGLLYYLGLLEAQTGRPDLAFPLWKRLVDGAPSDDPHRGLALGQIEEVAWLAGLDAPLVPQDAPSADEAAAVEMTPAAREEMIRAMVDGLATRLAAQGGPVEDWGRLVTSLAALGEWSSAEQALKEARAIFAQEAASLEALDEAARAGGMTPAEP